MVSLLHHTYNRMVKQTLRSCGSNATKAHMERVSLCALFLLEVCKLSDSMLGATRSTHHTTTSAKDDIEKLVTHLCDYSMVKEQPTRKEKIEFDDPVSKGMKKISQGWLSNFLSLGFSDESSLIESSEETVTDEIYELDMDYELFDYDVV